MNIGKGVHTLLGTPQWVSPDGTVDVYEASANALGLVILIPFPSPDEYNFYAMIAYDEHDRVVATDWRGTDTTASMYANRFDNATLFAGKYGFNTQVTTFFPSVDGGGNVDQLWTTYVDMADLYSDQMKYGLYSVYWQSLLRNICSAAEQGHPCAYVELGNYFWEGVSLSDKQEIAACTVPEIASIWSFFKKDNIRACVWYSLANNKIVPDWCLQALSPGQVAEVRRLLTDWQPSECEIREQLTPYPWKL